jgi:hypothetical protein
VARGIVAQQAVHLNSVLDLALVVVELPRCNIAPVFGSENLALDLLDLDADDLDLVTPLVLPTAHPQWVGSSPAFELRSPPLGDECLVLAHLEAELQELALLGSCRT